MAMPLLHRPNSFSHHDIGRKPDGAWVINAAILSCVRIYRRARCCLLSGSGDSGDGSATLVRVGVSNTKYLPIISTHQTAAGLVGPAAGCWKYGTNQRTRVDSRYHALLISAVNRKSRTFLGTVQQRFVLLHINRFKHVYVCCKYCIENLNDRNTYNMQVRRMSALPGTYQLLR